ncbi:probable elongator complex protein 2 [Cephus cinctus]|uniref:Elongator complex protein 2 n=1 Tax=Cephus cinctus TaxID=211228 RepID=A0AAJ7FE78_CEPCN|nr:probable elongator complex protein 2 [Cephus cinctus]
MTTRYICCACNRFPHSLDWGYNGVVCYGACNAVALYKPDNFGTGKVFKTLHRHSGRVIGLRWIKKPDLQPETEFLSASNDGTAIIWSKTSDTFEPTSILKNTDALTIANALYVPEDDNSSSEDYHTLIICTGSINGDFKLWKRNSNRDLHCFQTLELKQKLPVEAVFSFLPNCQKPLLALSMEDSSVQLYCQDSSENFIKVQLLVGHEDWIRCMDFAHDNNGNVLLATGSQDSTIRLWKISMDKEEIDPDELKQKKQQFLVEKIKYNVTLESILSSHEGWIYGIHWHPAKICNGKYDQPMKLLSSSLDKTMIIWEPDPVSGIWLESIRVGDVGGNSVGFYGCKFGPNGESILAHGYQGSFHIWKYLQETNNWAPETAPSGHFAEVVDLCWDSKGRFLMTTSSDQTTRIHAPWRYELDECWHEIGRPQVHGYDMSCLAMLSPYMFASGAEEKVIRTFTAPATFINYLKKLANANDFQGVLAESASVPALGLTNKAVFEGEKATGENLYVGYSKDLNYEQPPTEEELIQHTLWPELQKLYGHGYEIFSLAARHDGSMLATACKSTSPEHSAIILWSTKTWSQVQKLVSHQLTVTQLAFSPNDRFLVSVSRDRRWSLFQQDENSYNLIAASLKKDSLHSRIIWSCAWSHDSKYYATGSRDGKIGIWSTSIQNDNVVMPITSLDSKDNSVTAIAFAPLFVNMDAYVIAIGFDSGNIEIQKVVIESGNPVWKKYVTYNTSEAHHLTVKRLMFQPEGENSQKGILQLASCSCDHTVKIYQFNITELSLL